ncbi:MAG: hypothetical protein JW776_00755 [Candidatus Lokiarchaeota archaeon]|nr:hypothetical protein [Candidatus Lokiarchaeota archaeon]
MADPIVTRTLGVDFIYFDLLFLVIWIYFLVKRKYWIPVLWGFIGFLTYLIIDYYIWYIVMGSRTYTGPINPQFFFLWFTFSAGFAQFSYVSIMFEKRNFRDMKIFTLLFFIGWTIIGLFSQWIPLNDASIELARNMSAGNQRLIMSVIAAGNVVLALFFRWIRKLRWEDILYIFLVGTLVELNLELSLLVSGIRLEQDTWSVTLMLVNTIVEFNVGIIPMWFIMQGFLKMQNKHLFPPLSYKDFRHIQSDFNRITISEQINQNHSLKDVSIKIYGEKQVLHDIKYLKSV